MTMTSERRAELIETHETWLDYYLDAWESAADKGSAAAAAISLATAAQHAAILNALLALARQQVPSATAGRLTTPRRPR